MASNFLYLLFLLIPLGIGIIYLTAYATCKNKNKNVNFKTLKCKRPSPGGSMPSFPPSPTPGTGPGTTPAEPAAGPGTTPTTEPGTTPAEPGTTPAEPAAGPGTTPAEPAAGPGTTPAEPAPAPTQPAPQPAPQPPPQPAQAPDTTECRMINSTTYGVLEYQPENRKSGTVYCTQTPGAPQYPCGMDPDDVKKMMYGCSDGNCYPRNTAETQCSGTVCDMEDPAYHTCGALAYGDMESCNTALKTSAPTASPNTCSASSDICSYYKQKDIVQMPVCYVVFSVWLSNWLQITPNPAHFTLTVTYFDVISGTEQVINYDNEALGKLATNSYVPKLDFCVPLHLDSDGNLTFSYEFSCSTTTSGNDKVADNIKIDGSDPYVAIVIALDTGDAKNHVWNQTSYTTRETFNDALTKYVNKYNWQGTGMIQTTAANYIKSGNGWYTCPTQSYPKKEGIWAGC